MLKNTTKTILTISAFLLLLAAGACSKLCNSGYEGKRCNELSTTKYLGYWSAVDTPGNLTYTDTISQGPVLGDISFSPSLAGHRFNHAVNASVITTEITIPYQQPDSGGHFIKGTGTISSDSRNITLSYQIISIVDSPHVIGTFAGLWTRQN